MSRDVKFNIKLSIDGKEHIVTASTNVKKLATEFNNAYKESNKVKDSLLRFSQISSAFNNVMGGLQQLTGIMHEYTEASAVQEQAEVKLETVMRQRMNATDESIESIKKLASAQQELGIIGDEVQLEGAQQMATFLNEKSSIEVLLPAMNNLLAQQKGYNATGQDAVTIGNLIGKVMQGQTSALKRVGITFTEAEEKILKYGNESQRAATLAQVITNNVGNMNAALAQTETGKAKQLSNTIGDLKEEVGALFARLEPTIVAVGEFGLAFSAVASVASGLKAVWVGITGFTGAMSLAKVQVIAFTVCQKAQSVATAICTAVTNAARNAQIAYATGAGISTVATYALRAALISLMAATGVGLVIAGIGMAIGALINNSDEATESLKKLEQQKNNVAQASQQEAALLNQTRTAYELNIQKLKNFHGTKEQEKKIVEEMNNTYGQTMGYFSSVNEWYNALIKNSKAYTEQMIAEAQARQIANQIAENEQKKYELIYNQDGSKKRYSLKRERQLIIGKGLFHPTIEGVREVKGSSEFEKAGAKINALNKQNKALKGRLQRTIAKQPKMVVKGASTAPDLTDQKKFQKEKLYKKNNLKKDNAPKLKDNAQKLKDIEGNIDYYKNKLNTATAETAVTINKEIDAWQKKADAIRNAGKQTEPIYNEEAKNIEGIEDNISILQKQLRKATKEEAADINQRIEGWNNLANEIRNAGKEKPEFIENPENLSEIENNISILQEKQKGASRSAVAGYNDQIASLQKLAQQFSNATNILPDNGVFAELYKLSGKELKIKLKGVGIDRVREALQEVNELLNNPTISKENRSILNKQKQSLQGYEAELGKTAKTMQTLEGIGSAASSVAQLGQSFQALGDDSKEMAVAMASVSLAATIAQLVAGMVKKVNEGSVTVWDWIAGVAAGTAAVITTATQLKGIGAFAKGGVISGPTLALVGEYAGASNNPEVIAPLDKLRSMINPQGGIGGNVQFKISGRQLVGVIANETRISSKSGRRTNINI